MQHQIKMRINGRYQESSSSLLVMDTLASEDSFKVPLALLLTQRESQKHLHVSHRLPCAEGIRIAGWQKGLIKDFVIK